MKIAILTQPIKGNYGGVLQNYALQEILRRMGHEPITIDYRDHTTWNNYICSTLKSSVFWFFPSLRRQFMPYRGIEIRNEKLMKFVNQHIQLSSKQYLKYSMKAIYENQCDAIIVGSDQVWRPRYNPRTLADKFLKFAQNFKGRKIAYAASFGTECWEFNERQTAECSFLIKKFHAISVRENSGVSLCASYLHAHAQVVLDPTLLLDKDDYHNLCSQIKKSEDRFVGAYLLDPKDHQIKQIKEFAKSRNLNLKLFSAAQNATLSFEEWLAVYRDADYIITDSFHGTVFSILFQKDFFVYVNQSRGASRFDSILQTFNLESRKIHDFLDVISRNDRIDYSKVEKIRSVLKVRSLEFLELNLAHSVV